MNVRFRLMKNWKEFYPAVKYLQRYLIHFTVYQLNESFVFTSTKSPTRTLKIYSQSRFTYIHSFVYAYAYQFNLAQWDFHIGQPKTK